MGANPTERVKRSWKDILFGGDLRSGKAWTLFATRIALGFVFLWAGYEKIEKEIGGSYATSGFLKGVSGPFAFMFNGMSGNPAIEYLLVYGEFLIGISLILGVLTRVGGISGALMTALLYMSTLPAQAATFQGSYFDFLMSKNALVSYYVVYVLIFAAFVFLVPGRFLGLDGIIQKSKFVQSRPALAKLAARLG